jgi:Holliday junction resolvase
MDKDNKLCHSLFFSSIIKKQKIQLSKTIFTTHTKKYFLYIVTAMSKFHSTNPKVNYQKSKSNSHTQKIKVKKLYCNSDYLHFHIYNKYGNETGQLFSGCQINVIYNCKEFYMPDTGHFIEKYQQGIRWKKIPNTNSKIGTINQKGGVDAEGVFINLLKDIGYNVQKLQPGTPFADMISSKNNKIYLIQLKTHLSENSQYVELDDYHMKELIDLANKCNYEPLLINYYPHISSHIAINLINNKNIDLGR